MDPTGDANANAVIAANGHTGVSRFGLVMGAASVVETALSAAFLDRLRGRNDEASALFEKTVSLCRGQAEPDLLLLARLLLAQADFLISLNQTAAAQPLVREALEIRTKQPPAGFWSTDAARLLQAEATGSAQEADEIVNKLRSQFGDHAMIVRAAAERAAVAHDPTRRSAPTLALF